MGDTFTLATRFDLLIISHLGSDLKLSGLLSQSTKGSRIFVFGQAKRYTTGKNITETEIRRFIGASIGRIEEYKKTRSEQYGVFQPTILAYWTTSDFHPDGRKRAKEFGIWYLGGVALMQLAIKLGMER